MSDIFSLNHRRENAGAGETAQKLRVLAVLTKGPRFSSQHPYSSSQPLITQGSSGLGGYKTCTRCTDVHAGKTIKHLK